MIYNNKGRNVKDGQLHKVERTISAGTILTYNTNYIGWLYFYNLASYSRAIIVPNFTYTDSLNVLLVLNGVGVFGRMISNHLADFVGPLNMMIPTSIIAGIAIFSWMVVRTPGQLYAWTVVYGIIAGSMPSLFLAGISSLTSDLSQRGARTGMNFTIISLATLTGDPIGGTLIEGDGGNYIKAQAFMGACFFLGGDFVFAARLSRQLNAKRDWLIKI